MTTVSLFVVGRDGVLLADGQSDPRRTQKLLDAITATAKKPVKWYVVGSDHGDHTGGNVVLPADIAFVVHPTSRAPLSAMPRTPRRRMKNAAAAAAAGKPAPPPRVVTCTPAAMTGDKQVIDLGNMEAQVLFLGRAHTGGDLMLYLPKQKILFMSEAFLNRVFPAMRSDTSRWLKMIDRALALDVSIYVPGHGFIEANFAGRARGVSNALVKTSSTKCSGSTNLGCRQTRRANRRTGAFTKNGFSPRQDIIAIRKVYEEIEGKLK